MKKIILLFLCLISISIYADARMTAVMLGGSPVAAVSLYCSSTSDADVACEDFDGASECYTGGSSVCRSTYTRTVNGNGAVSFTSHSGTLSCADKGSYAAQFAASGATSTDVAYLGTTHTAVNSGYVKGRINLVSASGHGDGESWSSVTIGANSASNSLVNIKIKYVSGTGYVFCGEFKKSDGSYENSCVSTALTTNTWYEFEISWVKGTSAQVKIDSNTFDATNVYNAWQFGYRAFGHTGNSVGGVTRDWVIQIDNLKFDDDTLPGSCS